jgi:hypothetical protein
LDSKIDTTSGTLQTTITENYNYLDGKIDTTSGTLQDAIDALDTSLTDDIVWETVDTPFEQIRPKVAHQGKAIYTYGSMTIGGDLTVSGTTTTVHSEELTVADKIITVNAGEAGSGITGERYAGIEVDRGTEENYLFVYDEVQNNFRVGISGSLQAVATREDSPIDTRVPWWNEDLNMFSTAGNAFITIASGTSGDITIQAPDDVNINAEDFRTIVDDRILLYSSTGDIVLESDNGYIELESNTNLNLISTAGNIVMSSSGTTGFTLTDEGITLVSGSVPVNHVLSVTDVDSIDSNSGDNQLASAALIWQEMTTLSGALQSDIDDAINNLSNNYYNKTEIDDFNTGIYSTITSASGVLQDQIDALDDTYATDAELAAVSGTLQSAINDVATDLSTNYYTITQLDNGQLDNRYYTETEIDGMLEAQDTFLELTDTISSYNAGRILFTTASGVVDAAALTFDSATGLLSTTSVQLGTGGYVNEIVATVTSGTTDNQLPTAKAVWDLTEAAAAAVHTHYDVDAVYVSDTSWTYGTGFAAAPESLIVYVNGVKQRLGASYDCSVDVPGGVLTITFNYNVYSTDWVNVTYIL